jgi:hypothetical protein
MHIARMNEVFQRPVDPVKGVPIRDFLSSSSATVRYLHFLFFKGGNEGNMTVR